MRWGLRHSLRPYCTTCWDPGPMSCLPSLTARLPKMGINITCLYGFYDKYMERAVQHMVRIPLLFAPFHLLHSLPITGVTCCQGWGTHGSFWVWVPPWSDRSRGDGGNKRPVAAHSLAARAGADLGGEGGRTRRQYRHLI